MGCFEEDVEWNGEERDGLRSRLEAVTTLESEFALVADVPTPPSGACNHVRVRASLSVLTSRGLHT